MNELHQWNGQYWVKARHAWDGKTSGGLIEPDAHTFTGYSGDGCGQFYYSFSTHEQAQAYLDKLNQLSPLFVEVK